VTLRNDASDDSARAHELVEREASSSTFLASRGQDQICTQSADLRITNPTTQPHHQRVMVDVVEARLDVALDGPLVRESAFCFRSSLAGTQEASKMLQRSVSASARPEAVRGRIEVRLEHRLEDVLQRCLHDPVSHRRDAEAAKLPRLPHLRDHHSSDRAGPVGAGSKFRARVSDE